MIIPIKKDIDFVKSFSGKFVSMAVIVTVQKGISGKGDKILGISIIAASMTHLDPRMTVFLSEFVKVMRLRFFSFTNK